MSWIAPASPEIVWFEGPDAVSFLDAILSQDLQAMRPGEVARSFLLQPRGKLDHLMWVLRGDDLVGLVADPGRGQELYATLRRYRIRVKVEIEIETRPVWLVMGEAGSGGWSGDRTGTLDADLSWSTMPRKLVAGERPELPEGTEEQYEEARIQAGEPKWGVDVDEGTIPQETAFADRLIAYDKGCFLGQELVGRIHMRGHVNRFLRHLRLTAPAPAGSTIMSGDREVGTMTSVAGLVGLGMVRREVSPGETVLVGGIEARVAEIPA